MKAVFLSVLFAVCSTIALADEVCGYEQALVGEKAIGDIALNERGFEFDIQFEHESGSSYCYIEAYVDPMRSGEPMNYECLKFKNLRLGDPSATQLPKIDPYYLPLVFDRTEDMVALEDRHTGQRFWINLIDEPALEPNLIVNFEDADGILVEFFDQTELQIFVDGKEIETRLQPSEVLSLQLPPGEVEILAVAPTVNAGSEVFEIIDGEVTTGTIVLSSQELGGILLSDLEIQELAESNVISSFGGFSMSMVDPNGEPYNLVDGTINVYAYAIEDGSFNEGLGGIIGSEYLFLDDLFDLNGNQIVANDPSALFAQLIDELSGGDIEISVRARHVETQLPLEAVEVIRLGEFTINGSFEISPIPANQQIQLESTSGIITRTANVSGDGSFIFSDVPEGVYLLRSDVLFDNAEARSVIGLVDINRNVVFSSPNILDIQARPITLAERMLGVQDIVQDFGRNR